MSAVGIGQLSAFRLDGGNEDGDVLRRQRATVEQTVDPLEDLAGVAPLVDRTGGQCLERGGEQRRRHPLARDVRHQQQQVARRLALADEEDVSRDAARGHVVAVQLVAGGARQVGGKKRHLDLAGELELARQPPPLGRLLGQSQVAHAQRRHRGQRHQQLHVLLRELAAVQSRRQRDHAQRALAVEQRRRHQAAHAGGQMLWAWAKRSSVWASSTSAARPFSATSRTRVCE